MSDKWFNEEHYRSQKILQMNTTNYTGKTTMPATGWDADSYQAELTAWGVTALDNFNACNTLDYSGAPSSLTLAALNVSPNQYFSVPEYCQSVASYNIANPEAWTGTAPAEGWNAANMLDTMWSQYKVTAWEHYNANWATQLTNPSSLFDTSAYLDWRAQKMGELDHNTYTQADAIKAIQDLGINPVQDFFDFGQDNGLTTPPALSEPIQVDAPAGWTQWGTSSSPEEYDPYDNVTETINITADQTSYTGAAGQNTLFAAVWPADSSKATLNQNDVINGGGANAPTEYNTLQVNDFGNDWMGFNQQTNDAGENIASVTNIGRLQLNHSKVNTEGTWNFNTRGIEGLQQVDINNTGVGAIKLSELTASVKEINVSGNSSNKTNVFTYAANELNGANDTLTLGVAGVGSAAVAATASKPQVGEARAAFNISGIENLTVAAEAGTSNYMDLSAVEDMTALYVQGAGNAYIRGVPATGVKTYDASAATGDVNIAVGTISNSTVVKGGQGGLDLVTITQESLNLSKPVWTGVEGIAVAGTVTTATINAANITGLQQLQTWGSAASVSLKNVAATDFLINSSADTGSGASTTVKGDIQNLTYYTHSKNAGKVESDVSGNVDINIANLKNHSDSFTGTFNAKKATGDVTLHVAKADGYDASGTAVTSEFGGTVNAGSAATFTADIAGTLLDNTTFNVVQGDPAVGRSVSITSTQAKEQFYASGIKIDADGARDASLNLTGSMRLASGSDLSNVQNLNIELVTGGYDLNGSGGTDSAARISQFDASSLADLKAIQNLKVDAGGEDVTFTNLGDSANRAGAINASITDAAAIVLGTSETTTGENITLNLEALGTVKLGNITAGTAANGNNEGDVFLTVSASASSASKSAVEAVSNQLKISGDDLNINFSGVESGAVASASGILLNASGTITYVGGEGDDGSSAGAITVETLGTGTSTFDMNNGNDFLKFAKNTLSDYFNVSVELGEGDDNVTFDAGSIKGAANIEVSLGEGSDTLTVDASASTIGGKNFATLDVTCGDGVDTLAISSQTSGNLLVNVSDFETATDKIALAASAFGSESAAKAALQKFGIPLGEFKWLKLDEGITDNPVAEADATGVLMDGTLYFVNDPTAPTTLVAIEGYDGGVVSA